MFFLHDPLFSILSIGDDQRFQRTLKLALKEHGFEVVTASPGIDALMQFRAHQGNFGSVLVIHDGMELNGLHLVVAVREMGYVGRIFIIYGHLTAMEIQAYLPHGISGSYTKRFEMEMLAAMLLQSH